MKRNILIKRFKDWTSDSEKKFSNLYLNKKSKVDISKNFEFHTQPYEESLVSLIGALIILKNSFNSEQQTYSNACLFKRQ